MAQKRLFALRKQLNALHRPPPTRTFSSEYKSLDTHDEKVAFLRSEDERWLRETHVSLNALMDSIEQAQRDFACIPTAVQPSDKSIPAYTNAVLRQRLNSVATANEKVQKASAHIQDHLDDLLHMPYEKQEAFAKWRSEIAKMSRADKEDRLKVMQFEEEAEIVRLSRDTTNLLMSVKRLEEGQKKGRSLDDMAAVKNPYEKGEAVEKKTGVGSSEKGSEVKSFTIRKHAGPPWAAGVESEARQISVAAAPEADSSLADLQKQIEDGIYGSKT